MSSSSTPAIGYHFDDLTQAKGDWPLFYNEFQTRLAASKLSWVLIPNQLLARSPGKFAYSRERQRRLHLRLRDTLAMNTARSHHNTARSLYDDHCGEALSILQKLLPAPSVANSEINGICIKYNTQRGKFIHAWVFIKDKYCPSNGEDAEVLRSKLVGLRDTNGFTTFAREFNLVLEQLRLIKHMPTDDELNVIVKNAITNESLVNLCVAPYTLDPEKPFAWDACLVRCSRSMKQEAIRRTQADLQVHHSGAPDLGKKVTSDLGVMAAKLDKLTVAYANFQPSSSNMLSLGAAHSTKRCSKCCRDGHFTKECTEKTCSMCHLPIEKGVWHDCPSRPDAKTTSQRVKDRKAKSQVGAKRTAENITSYSEGSQQSRNKPRIAVKTLNFIKANPGRVMEILSGNTEHP